MGNNAYAKFFSWCGELGGGGGGSNLVPRAFPLKNGWEKPWGRVWGRGGEGWQTRCIMMNVKMVIKRLQFARYEKALH